MVHQLTVATQVAQDVALDPVAGLIFSQSTHWKLIAALLIILLGLARLPIFITELWARQKFKEQLQEAGRSE